MTCVTVIGSLPNSSTHFVQVKQCVAHLHISKHDIVHNTAIKHLHALFCSMVTQCTYRAPDLTIVQFIVSGVVFLDNAMQSAPASALPYSMASVHCPKLNDW